MRLFRNQLNFTKHYKLTYKSKMPSHKMWFSTSKFFTKKTKKMPKRKTLKLPLKPVLKVKRTTQKLVARKRFQPCQSHISVNLSKSKSEKVHRPLFPYYSYHLNSESTKPI